MKITDVSTEFPETVIDFASDLAKLCKKHSLSEFQGEFRPGWKANVWGAVHFNWNGGRHGEDSGRIHIRSEKQITLDIT